MITHFKTALNQIKAEDELVNKTEMYLRETLTKKQNLKIINFTNDRLFSMKKLAMVAALIIVFLSGSTGAYAYYKTPVSYLSLDINPSVELGVNAFNKVVKVEGYNDDGEKILTGIDVTGLSVEEAIKNLIASASDNGYISDDGSTVISFTSETDDSKIATKLETDSETGANEALNENGKTAVIYKDNVPLSLNEEANTLGITAGKLNIIRKLQETDPTVTVEQYKNESVKNILKTIQENNSKGNLKKEYEGDADKNKEGTENKKEGSNLDKNKEGTESDKDGSNLDNNNEGTESKKDGSTVDKKVEDSTNNNKKDVEEKNNKTIYKANTRNKTIENGNDNK
jgi:hypothetical protein